jgi:hypothetical protein
MIVLDKKFVKVRMKRNGKLHPCHQCNRDIPVGTEVESASYIDEGEGKYMLYTCKPCLDYINEYIDEIVWEGAIPECGVFEHLYGFHVGDANKPIEVDAYWRGVKHFGYGGEKWD